MGMRNMPLECAQPLSASQIADLRLAASKMTGPTRRALQAEMTLKYCQGNPLQAETVFGWGRHTVALGLSERRTGILCLGAQAAFSGRKRWEDQHPEVAEALGAQGYSAEQLPSPSTMAEVLKRMGFRLRKVVKAKPQKRIAETEAIFANIEKRPSSSGLVPHHTFEDRL